MENHHPCILFSFEQGRRHMSTSWLVEYYTKTFRLQHVLRASGLKDHIDKDCNSKATLSMCTRVRTRGLNIIISDYKTQTGQTKDHLCEVYQKNPRITNKVKTLKDRDKQYVFKFPYSWLGALKKGFLDRCNKVISLDASFLKAALNGQVFAISRDATNQMYTIA